MAVKESLPYIGIAKMVDQGFDKEQIKRSIQEAMKRFENRKYYLICA